MFSYRIAKWVKLEDTKVAIIATIGPKVYDVKSSGTLDLLGELVGAGVTAFRINFSHVSQNGEKYQNGKTKKYSFAEVTGMIDRIRVIEAEKKLPIPIIMDLKGPEIRIAELRDEDDQSQTEITITKKSRVYISQIADGESPKRIPDKPDQTGQKNDIDKTVCVYMTYDGDMLHEIKNNHIIRIDDGRIELRVVKKYDDCAICEVISEGDLKLDKSVNLPQRPLYGVEDVIKKDRGAIERGFDIDLVAQSFVRSCDDIIRLGEMLTRIYQEKDILEPLIIAKIETKEAAELENFRKILEHRKTFGIMVGRGDLGGELGIAEVPGKQLELIEAANIAGKPVIVATQMLESMREAPVPTRAEAQDVWSAIREGADAVMLSGETASGKYPIRAVEEMSKIIEKTKLDMKQYRCRFFQEQGMAPGNNGPLPRYAVDVVGYPVVTLAEQSQSPFIITYATKGWSATKISRFRPDEPTRILALTMIPQKARVLRLLYGVYPVLLEQEKDGSLMEGGDLPRARVDVIAASRRVITHICGLSDCARCNLDRNMCRDRYVVATFADTKPESDWDTVRVLLVFKMEE